MRGLYLKLNVIILLSVLLYPLYGQNLTFNHINTDNGLSQFSVNDLYVDESDIVWIGTREGLNRYNGNDIKTYKLEKDNPYSLFCNNVIRITGDGDGNLYLRSTEGLAKFNITSQQFTALSYGDITAMYFNKNLYTGMNETVYKYNEDRKYFEALCKLPNSSIRVTAIFIDTNDNMWIGTNNDGLYLLENNMSLKHIIEDANITGIYPDSFGNLWIGSWEHGLYKVDKNREILNLRHNPKDVNTISSDFVRSCCEDNNGDIWIGTFQGLDRLNPKTFEFAHYKADGNPGGLSHSSIWSIGKDRQGTLWLGTYFGGVNYFNPEYEIYNSYKESIYEGPGLSSPIVGRMIEDDKENIWICTEGGGVNVFNKNTETFKWYKHEGNNSISQNNVKSIYYDKDGQAMWIGTHLGGLNRLDLKTNNFKHYKYNPNNPYSLSSDIIRDILPYNDSLIIATQEGLCMFDKVSGKSITMFKDHELSSKIRMIADLEYDSDGTLWFAVTGVGLLNYNLKKDILKLYNNDIENKTSLSNNNVNKIFLDSNNNLWIGTSGSGLDLYDRKNDCFINFDNKNGLQSDCIYDINESDDNELIIITNMGFTCFDVNEKRAKNYNADNGFPMTALNENALYITKEKDVYLGGINGMISFNINRLNFKEKPYKIMLSKLLINGEEIKVSDESNILTKTLCNTPKITLSSKQNMFTFEYATTNYIKYNKEEIVYALKGFSDTWNKTRGEKYITYTNIHPGKYTLIVKPENKNSLTSPISVEIEILPPYYKTIWAYLIYVVLIGGLFIWLVINYKSRIKLQESLKYEQKHIRDVEMLNQSKLKFFTNISHEFRTPLTLIVGQIEALLQLSGVSPAIYNRILVVYKNSLQLKELISELLDFRKQEQSMMKLKVRKQNIVDFINENYLLFVTYATNQGIKIKFNKEVDSLDLWYDRVQMQKVINNLLSNAIKHSKKDGVIIISLNIDGDNAVIKVKDNGKGIAEQDIKNIFELFYQTDSEESMSLSNPGTGIGLALTKGIVELHHGNIRVESKLGEGSQFIVTLPLGKDHFTEDQFSTETNIVVGEESPIIINNTEIEDDTTIVAPNKDVTILIVEDNDGIRELLCSLFEPLYNVIEAVDGADALEKAKQHTVDIILSDVLMPRMSGIELCKEIKSDYNTCHIPVILLTARTAIEHNLEGLLTGADDYITKPFDSRILVSRCNNLINTRIMLRERFTKQPAAQTNILATNKLDKDLLDRASAIIEEHLDDVEFSVNIFASKMGIARTNLFSKLKAITGQTPNDFILSIRLKRATEMLINNPELNMTEISDRTGFSSSRYFSKCFKDCYQITPLAYRKKLTGVEANEETEIVQE